MNSTQLLMDYIQYCLLFGTPDISALFIPGYNSDSEIFKIKIVNAEGIYVCFLTNIVTNEQIIIPVNDRVFVLVNVFKTDIRKAYIN